MSLSIGIKVSEEENSFIVRECTGQFSYSNKGGYGVSNPAIKDVSKAWLEVTKRATGEKYTIDTYPYLPNIDNTGFEVLPVKVGSMNGGLDSGVYDIVYYVSGTHKGKEFKAFTVATKVFTKQVECCVDKHAKTINKDAFKDPKQKEAILMNNLLESLCYQIDCELFDAANDTIEDLKLRCQCCGC